MVNAGDDLNVHLQYVLVREMCAAAVIFLWEQRKCKTVQTSCTSARSATASFRATNPTWVSMGIRE